MVTIASLGEQQNDVQIGSSCLRECEFQELKMRHRRVSSAIFSLSTLFFSLNAFSVRATAISYVLVCLLAFLNSPTLSRRTESLVRIATYWWLTVFFAFVVSAFGDFYINSYIKFLLMQMYICLIYWMFSSDVLNRVSMEWACQFLIYTHAAFFLFQLAYYLTTGHFIDFDNYVRETDAEALYATKALNDSLISIRALGLYSEPSFYAMTVVPCGTLLLLLKRRVTIPSVVAFGTALLSFSVAAMIIVAMICALYVIFGQVPNKIRLAAFVVALLSIPPLYHVYDLRVNQSVDYDAVASRTLVFNEIEKRDVLSNVFGNGLFWNEQNNVGKTHLRGFNVRDSSFYVYIVFAAGGFGALVFCGALLYMLWVKGRRQYIFYLFAILLFKYHVLYGMFWLTVLMFLVLSRQVIQPTVFRLRS